MPAGIKPSYVDAEYMIGLQPWITKILAAIGQPGASVTENTLMSDFSLTAQQIQDANTILGTSMVGDEYLFEIVDTMRG